MGGKGHRVNSKAGKRRKRARSLRSTQAEKRAALADGLDRPDGSLSSSAPPEQTSSRSNHNVYDIEFLSQLVQPPGMEVTPDSLLESHPKTSEILSNSDRVETAAIFGTMLLDERLQSNCIRLEALIHLAVAVGSGTKLATQTQLAACFNELGDGVCGRTEDPAEDVFVSLVTTSEGNFRVLEGIWESGTFYLQRILDMIETMPDEGSFSVLRQRVFALLKLSEVVCNRAGLARYSVGATLPRATITQAFCSKAKRKTVFFDRDDLANMGLTTEAVASFILNDDVLPRVLTEPITNSPLQRFPIMDAGDRIALVLPSAVSSAIRTAAVEFLLTHGYQDSFRTVLARQYSALFHNTRLLGSFRGAPIFFSEKEGLPIAEFMTAADEGRYLHVVFFTDTLDHFQETGLAGVDPGPSLCADVLEERILAVIEHTRQQSGYRDGVTLLVHCGIGRGVALPIPAIEHKDWSVQFISAPDLFTLSCTSRFNVLKLWKTLEGVTRLTDLGVQIHNHNGLLNLIAWVDANDGHLISHSQVPKGFRTSQGGLLIAANFVLDLRHSVAIENDRHGVRAVDGRIKVVRRMEGSFFPEDNDIPIYVVGHFSSENGLPFVYVSERRSWWCHVMPSEERAGDYDRWLMLETWLTRIVPVIEPILGDSLGDTVLLRVKFGRVVGDRNCAPVPTRDDIQRSCSVIVNAERSTVTVEVGEQFDLGLSVPTNVSERALVVAICDGFAQLANVSLTAIQLSELESQIVASDDARQMHAFQARKYREFLHEDLGQDLIQLDEGDVAGLRSGLAFRVESRAKGRSSLRSKRECTQLLNAIVRDLEDELCSELRRFDRASFVELSLRNHEKAAIECKKWTGTARAAIALRQDKKSAQAVITEHEMKLHGVLFLSRVLIEFAICECATSAGIRAGHLDFSKLMAKASLIWQLGGWSDAIHLDAMPPALTISPLGDIKAVAAFSSNVLMPFWKERSQDRIDTASKQYEENFQLAVVSDASESKLDPEFEDAWNSEFGFTVSDLRTFMDAIEDIGCERNLAVFAIKRSELALILDSQFELEHGEQIVRALSLCPRDTWRTIPEGFHEKDTQPWRFRRQLSAVRRPLFQIDSSDDPVLMIAPGSVRECVAYVLGAYFEGEFPGRHYRSDAMRRWHDERRKSRGEEFVKAVAGKITELGWNIAETEMDVKEIIGSSQDPEFGDVRRFGDVDVLAWNPAATRVLVIECKHLQFHKTPGEVAEQLSDYRGVTKMKSGGKLVRDDLRKHVERLEILTARRSALCKTIGVDNGIRIEGWILFKNPVPMLYSWKEFETSMQIATFDDIEKMLGIC